MHYWCHKWAPAPLGCAAFEFKYLAARGFEVPVAADSKCQFWNMWVTFLSLTYTFEANNWLGMPALNHAPFAHRAGGWRDSVRVPKASAMALASTRVASARSAIVRAVRKTRRAARAES